MLSKARLLAMAAAIGIGASMLLPAGVSQAQKADEVTKLRVGYIPVGVYAYFWRARDAGYFKKENLEIELVPMAGGGQIIPALQSGSLQFGISDALGVLNARNGGIPATFVSFNFSQSSEDPVHAVLTMDPSVKKPKDLNGKSIATNLSFNTDWTVMREWLRRNEVDINSINFREIPFPDMLAALRNGTVAAAGVIEPYYTYGEEQGARVLGYHFTDVQSPIVLSGIVAMTPYADQNPEIVERFMRAVNQAIDDFNTDRKLAREAIAANTKIPPAVVEKMRLGNWETKVPLEQIQFWVDAARKEGIVTDATDLKALIWQSGK